MRFFRSPAFILGVVVSGAIEIAVYRCTNILGIIDFFGLAAAGPRWKRLLK